MLLLLTRIIIHDNRYVIRMMSNIINDKQIYPPYGRIMGCIKDSIIVSRQHYLGPRLRKVWTQEDKVRVLPGETPGTNSLNDCITQRKM